MRWQDDGGVESFRSFDRCVEIGDFTEPHENAVARLDVWITDASVVVFGLPFVELQYEHTVRQEPFVVRAPVITLEAEQLLVPIARRFDVAHREQRLGLHG